MRSEAGERLESALRQVVEGMPDEVKAVPIEHWTEGVFRHLLIRQIRASYPGQECWSEWNRVDLVLPSARGATLVELKLFVVRPRHTVAGSRGFKGGPGSKNEREVLKSIATLAASRAERWSTDCGGIQDAYFALAWADTEGSDPGRSYTNSYFGPQALPAVRGWTVLVDGQPLPGRMRFYCLLGEVPLTPAA